MRFLQGDMVELRGKTASGEAVPVGAIGKVIMVCPENCYEVLFRDKNNRVLDVATIVGDDLRLVQRLEKTA